MAEFRRLLVLATGTGLLLAKLAFAQDPNVQCFNNAGTLTNRGPNIYQTQSACQSQCSNLGLAVWATTQGRLCYCGNEYPSSGEVDYVSNCSTKCLAWPQQYCGGTKAWTVGYTGVGNLEQAPASSGTSDPSSTTSSAFSQVSSSDTDSPGHASTPTIMSTVVPSPSTVIITGSGKPTSTSITALNADSGLSKSSSGGSGARKAGIAAGVVVGVIAAIAIGIGLWLLYRRGKRLDAEEEYRAAVSNKEFVTSIKKPELDQRLEPAMLQKRRLSDGSIADNQDFSRRILKITNPDD